MIKFEKGDKVSIGGILGTILEVLENGSLLIRLYDGAKIEVEAFMARRRL